VDIFQVWLFISFYICVRETLGAK